MYSNRKIVLKKSQFLEMVLIIVVITFLQYLRNFYYRELGNNRYKKGDLEVDFETADEGEVLTVSAYEYL